MSTPRTETITLAALESQTCHVAGKFMQVKQCTVASFEFAFNNDGFQAGEPYCTYSSPEPFNYVRFRESLGAPATIVVTVSDEEPRDDRGNRDQLLAIAASLAAMDLDLDTLALILADTTAANLLLGLINADTTAINVDTTAIAAAAAAAAASLAAIDGDTDAIADVVTLLDVKDNPVDIIPTMIPISGGAPGEVEIVAGAAINRVVCLRALHTNAGDVWLRLQTGVSNLVYSIPLHPGESWHEEWSGSVFACSENGTEALCGYVTRI